MSPLVPPPPKNNARLNLNKFNDPNLMGKGHLRKRNFVVMGFVMKVLWQYHTFVMKHTLNALLYLSYADTSLK